MRLVVLVEMDGLLTRQRRMEAALAVAYAGELLACGDALDDVNAALRRRGYPAAVELLPDAVPA